MIATFLCFGATSCSTKQVALSVTGITAAVVITTVGVTMAIQNSHHTLNGCVSSGPKGLELRTSDAKTYTLQGISAPIKVGDRVKLHGSKLKKTKDSVSDPVFVVEKLNKDFGPCS